MKSNGLVSLSGAVAVVTGGGRGIGQAIVSRLAEMDATVVLTDEMSGASSKSRENWGPRGIAPKASDATSPISPAFSS